MIGGDIESIITCIEDYSTLKEIFPQKGKIVEVAKKEYFIQQNKTSSIAGWKETALFIILAKKMRIVKNMLSAFHLRESLFVITPH